MITLQKWLRLLEVILTRITTRKQLFKAIEQSMAFLFGEVEVWKVASKLSKLINWKELLKMEFSSQLSYSK
jgi:hypothetical protein